MKTKQIIFYSWQSDLPNRTNRGFIENCLRKAVSQLKSEDEVAVEPVIDRDVQGTSGANNISEIIFAKIENCAVFVADVSTINQSTKKRKTPNPNVMIELGYAAKCVTYDNIIMVLNRAYGSPEQLPFDLKLKKAIQYDLHEEVVDKTAAQEQLVRALKDELKQMLSNPKQTPNESPFEIAVTTVKKIVSQARHEYQLAVVVTNKSTQRLDDYNIDIEIPAKLCIAPANRDSYVKVRSTRSHCFFRVTPTLLGGHLYPGDHVPINNLFFYVDQEIYFDHRELLSEPIRITAYAAGLPHLSVQKTIQELSNY